MRVHHLNCVSACPLGGYLMDGVPAARLRGRLASQAPDIDPVVYLTDCDPSTIAPGQFLEAEVVGARGYDLLARPLL